MIKKFIHNLYVILGAQLNNYRLLFWRVRDRLIKPKEDSILFIAHPDDDTLFFHTYIKEHKPYVVLLTTGWSLRRYPCFRKVMKYYGVKYRAYNLPTIEKNTYLIEECVREVLEVVNPAVCATHNAEGEYGHEMHQRVHSAVKKLSNCKLLVPVSNKDIEEYPLNKKIVEEKTLIFKNYYTTELFVLDQYRKWLENEKLT